MKYRDVKEDLISDEFIDLYLEATEKHEMMHPNQSGWNLIIDFVHQVKFGKTPPIDELETIASCFKKVIFEGERFERAFNVSRRDLSKEQKRSEHLYIGSLVYHLKKKNMTLDQAKAEVRRMMNVEPDKAHSAYLLFLKSIKLEKKK